jgi:hypothetical protein
MIPGPRPLSRPIPIVARFVRGSREAPTIVASRIEPMNRHGPKRAEARAPEAERGVHALHRPPEIADKAAAGQPTTGFRRFLILP